MPAPFERDLRIGENSSFRPILANDIDRKNQLRYTTAMANISHKKVGEKVGLRPIAVKSRCREAADQIRSLVRQGNLREGDQLPGERGLAETLGVSYMTVRQAVAQLVREGMLRREQGRGTFVESAAPDDPITRRTIAAIMPWGREASIGMHVLAGVEESARQYRKHVCIFNTATRSEKLPEMLEEAYSAGIRGMIVWPEAMTDRASLDTLAHMEARDVSIVFVDRYWIEYPTDRVVTDEDNAAVQVITHLKEQGYQSIWYVGSSDTFVVTAARDRLAAINRAAGKLGIALTSSGAIHSPEERRDFLQRMFAENPNCPAIVCQNNQETIAISRLLEEFHVQPPMEVGLLGYDDSCPVPAHLPVPVTMVKQDFEEIGVKAVELLMDRLEGDSESPPRSVEVPVTLILRQSTNVRNRY